MTLHTTLLFLSFGTQTIDVISYFILGTSGYALVISDYISLGVTSIVNLGTCFLIMANVSKS